MLGDRWGVSESETVRPYPCDNFVASPVLTAWHGVHVKAPIEAVWPWVAQVRLGRTPTIGSTILAAALPES